MDRISKAKKRKRLIGKKEEEDSRIVDLTTHLDGDEFEKEKRHAKKRKLKDGLVERHDNLREKDTKEEEKLIIIDLPTSLVNDDLEEKEHVKIQKLKDLGETRHAKNQKLKDGMIEICDDVKGEAKEGPQDKQTNEKMHVKRKESKEDGVLERYDYIGQKPMDDVLEKKMERRIKCKRSLKDGMVERCEDVFTEKEDLKEYRKDDNESNEETVHAVDRVSKTYDVVERCDDAVGRDKEGPQDKQAKNGGLKDNKNKEKIHAKHKEDDVLEKCDNIVKSHEQEGVRTKPMGDDGLEKKRKKHSKHRKSAVEANEKEGQKDKATEDSGSEKETVHAVNRVSKEYDVLERCDVIGRGNEDLLDRQAMDKIQTERNQLKEDGVLERCDDIVKPHEHEGLRAKPMSNDGSKKKMKKCSNRRKSERDDALQRCDDVFTEHEKEGQKDKTIDGDGSKETEHVINGVSKTCDVLESCDDVKKKQKEGPQDKQIKDGVLEDKQTKEKIHAKHQEMMEDNVLERCDDFVKQPEKEGLKAKPMGADGLVDKMKTRANQGKSKKVGTLGRCNDVKLHENEGSKEKTMDYNGSEEEKLFAVNTLSKKYGVLEKYDDEEGKRKVGLEDGTTEKTDHDWLESLSDSHLDVLVSIKKLAVECNATVNSKHTGQLLPSALRTIGILLEELAKDRAQSLIHTRMSSGQANQGRHKRPCNEG